MYTGLSVLPWTIWLSMSPILFSRLPEPIESEMIQWKLEYWQYEPKLGAALPPFGKPIRDLPKEAKRIAAIELYRFGTKEVIGTAFFADVRIKAGVSNWGIHPKLGPIVTVRFSLESDNPKAILRGYKMAQQVVIKDIVFGERKVLSSGWLSLESLTIIDFVTVTVSKIEKLD